VALNITQVLPKSATADLGGFPQKMRPTEESWRPFPSGLIERAPSPAGSGHTGALQIDQGMWQEFPRNSIKITEWSGA
jgi:hypothetical protein